MLDDRRIEKLKRRIEQLELSEDAWGAGTDPDDPGAVRIENLNHKDPIFNELWLHPVLLAVLQYLLVDFRLGSMTQSLTSPPYGSSEASSGRAAVFESTATSCQTVWMLDDFNAVRGTTRLSTGVAPVPGQNPEDVVDDAEAAHPDQLLVEAPSWFAHGLQRVSLARGDAEHYRLDASRRV